MSLEIPVTTADEGGDTLAARKPRLRWEGILLGMGGGGTSLASRKRARSVECNAGRCATTAGLSRRGTLLIAFIKFGGEPEQCGD